MNPMGKLVVVQDDGVEGTDKHNVTGVLLSPPPNPYAGIGSYHYAGKITAGLSTFVTIAGTAVALVTSTSSLNPGEAATGGHAAKNGSNFVPSGVDTGKPMAIPDPVGTGVPNAAAGSELLTIGGIKVLLDGDKIDTCDGTGGKAN